MSHSSSLFIIILISFLFVLCLGIWIEFLVGFSKDMREAARIRECYQPMSNWVAKFQN